MNKNEATEKKVWAEPVYTRYGDMAELTQKRGNADDGGALGEVSCHMEGSLEVCN